MVARRRRASTGSATRTAGLKRLKKISTIRRKIAGKAKSVKVKGIRKSRKLIDLDISKAKHFKALAKRAKTRSQKVVLYRNFSKAAKRALKRAVALLKRVSKKKRVSKLRKARKGTKRRTRRRVGRKRKTRRVARRRSKRSYALWGSGTNVSEVGVWDRVSGAMYAPADGDYAKIRRRRGRKVYKRVARRGLRRRRVVKRRVVRKRRAVRRKRVVRRRRTVRRRVVRRRR